MTPHEIIAGLRAAGVCPLLPRESGRILRTGGRRDLLESAHALNLMLEMHRQHAGCIEFLRSEFQPWQPARCLIGDEIDEMLAGAWPDADPPMREILRIPLETAAIAESARLSLRMRISSARLPPRQNYPGQP